MNSLSDKYYIRRNCYEWCDRREQYIWSFFLGYMTMRFIVDFHLDSVFDPLVCVDKDGIDDK